MTIEGNISNNNIMKIEATAPGLAIAYQGTFKNVCPSNDSKLWLTQSLNAELIMKSAIISATPEESILCVRLERHVLNLGLDGVITQSLLV
jgi:hypothetical protein